MQRLGRGLWYPNALVSDVFFLLTVMPVAVSKLVLHFCPSDYSFIESVPYDNISLLTISVQLSRVVTSRYHIAKIPIVVMSIEKGNDVSETS